MIDTLAAGLPEVVVNVIVPERAVPVFAEAVNVTGSDIKPNPEVVFALTHEGIEEICQDVFEGTNTFCEPPPITGDHDGNGLVGDHDEFDVFCVAEYTFTAGLFA